MFPVAEVVYGDTAALFVVHGPVTLVASSKEPADQVNTTLAPDLLMLNVGGVKASVVISLRSKA